MLKSKHRLMIGTAAKHILSRVPQRMAQGILRTVQPRVYAHLQQLRHRANGERGDLAPFDDLRCIFVHIPKCAGTSVAQSLLGMHPGHWSLGDYRLIFSEQELREYFKFTFVRNPWDRLVSAYCFLREGGLNQGSSHWASVHLSPYADFEDFVLRGLVRWNIRRWYHFRPQIEFIQTHWCDKFSMDYIGRMENLEDDYKKIAERLQCSAQLSRINQGQSRRPDYRSYFSPRTRAIVERYYRADIQTFGYEF